MNNEKIFGFVRPLVDVHTMGMFAMANLLKDCNYTVHIADSNINKALEQVQKINNYSLIKSWIINNHITHLCFSYRLDPIDACDYFMQLYHMLVDDHMTIQNGGCIQVFSFAGLPAACQQISEKTNQHVLVFPGGESPLESLEKYGIPKQQIDSKLVINNAYDNMRWDFAKKVIESEAYKNISAQDHYGYSTCGTDKDTFIDRLNYSRSKHSLPVVRTHSGPYNPNRVEALKEYNSWVTELANSRLLDVLSIGSSQLTQSHFGEDWEGLQNGGGVPINSPLEYRIIREKAKPMLVRTYSGTKDVPSLAQMHEDTLNISWHALSFWWFNELDGRGKNTLLENLKEHFEAIKYIVSTGKPVEPNVPHHFAFRGADDITYIISGFLAAKACKLLGVRHLILQNMLNTPKNTWGVQDLAKGRAMLRLVKELEDSEFTVSLQSRVGLDYFSTDLEEAKVQLAAATCMMDDVDPENEHSPEIVHVVNYSEAVHLANPKIIQESIKITLAALKAYRQARAIGSIPNMAYDTDTNYRTEQLYSEAKEAIALLEQHITNLYTPEGFYKVFTEGFLPVPYLMDHENKYPKATMWQTALKDGGMRVIDHNGNVINTIERYKKILNI